MISVAPTASGDRAVDSDEILSGGNFPGVPQAIAFDYSAIAMAQLRSISVRSIDRLTNPDLNEGLPTFSSANPGKPFGYMMVHVSANAPLNESCVLAHPASVDNVPSSGGKEGHVSMSMTSAVKLRRIVENAENVLAIELLVAADGLDYRSPQRFSPPIERARRLARGLEPRLAADRSLSRDIGGVAAAIRRGVFSEFGS